jgi:tRNA1(Val) A37 N6-methylase TrmN6
MEHLTKLNSRKACITSTVIQNCSAVLCGLKKRIRVLDVGCATGALLCYAAVQRPASLCGIDLFPEVIAQAEKNLKQNAIDAKLSVCRMQEFRPTGLFDVIVCNPPYFDTKKEDLKNRNPYLSLARHETSLSMLDLFQHAERLLNEDGVLYLVHRADRLAELFHTAEEFHLIPIRMRLAYKSMHGTASSVLLCFGKGRERVMRVDPPVLLDDRTTFEDWKGEGR